MDLETRRTRQTHVAAVATIQSTAQVTVLATVPTLAPREIPDTEIHRVRVNLTIHLAKAAATVRAVMVRRAKIMGAATKAMAVPAKVTIPEAVRLDTALAALVAAQEAPTTTAATEALRRLQVHPMDRPNHRLHARLTAAVEQRPPIRRTVADRPADTVRLPMVVAQAPVAAAMAARRKEVHRAVAWFRHPTHQAVMEVRRLAIHERVSARDQQPAHAPATMLPQLPRLARVWQILTAEQCLQG